MANADSTSALPSVLAHHPKLTQYVAERGGLDPTRTECACCQSPAGPFTVRTDEGGGWCLICSAQDQGADQGESETVETIVHALFNPVAVALTGAGIPAATLRHALNASDLLTSIDQSAREARAA